MQIAEKQEQDHYNNLNNIQRDKSITLAEFKNKKRYIPLKEDTKEPLVKWSNPDNRYSSIEELQASFHDANIAFAKRRNSTIPVSYTIIKNNDDLARKLEKINPDLPHDPWTYVIWSSLALYGNSPDTIETLDHWSQ